MKRINMWSGPRNVSTALMYAFAQCPNTRVVDEPFYAHYLNQTGVNHPGWERILASQSTDAAKVLDQLLSANSDKELLFIKNMAHHMIAMDVEVVTLIQKCQTIFLIRDPHEMLPSLSRRLANPTLRDTAYKRLHELFEMLNELKRDCCVIDSRELLKNPRMVLSALRDCLGIAFDEKMLHWKKGGLKADGVWARYWYDSVHGSTGFMPNNLQAKPFPERLKPLLMQCKPYYDKTFAHAIKAKY